MQIEDKSSLGKITKFVAASKKHPKAARFCLHALAWDLLPNERIRVCQHVPIPDRSDVEILHNNQTNSARYHGLMRCGLAWVCALCQMRIAEKRRDLLLKAFDNARGHYEPFLATYTLRHERTDNLADLIGKLTAAYRFMRQARQWRATKEEFAIVGEIRGLEITYSPMSGWHPHFHVVEVIGIEAVQSRRIDEDQQYIEPPEYDLTKSDRVFFSSTLERQLWSHWIAALRHFDADAEKGPGVQCQPGEFVQYYIAKLASWGLAHELTAQNRKEPKVNGETIWDILLRHYAGDPLAKGLFLEYHAATKGRSSLQWTPGLKALLGVSEQDENETLDDPDDHETLLMRLTLDDWRFINRAGAEGHLLDLASKGDYEKLALFLAGLKQKFAVY